MKKLSCRRKEAMLIYNYRIPLQYGGIHDGKDISVGSVEINTEKSFLYHPEYKGVRLDVYAKDENNTHYDVEMQVAKKEALAKRTRYYHSQMDMELLVKGKDYSELPKACVIFICDFDPFEEKKYRN